jgi:hypothetical protein
MGRKKGSTINRLANFSRNGGEHPNKRQKLDGPKSSAKENKEVSQKILIYPGIYLP